MNISTFKHHAVITEDNRETASKNWSKSWGFDFWYRLWGFRTYEYGRFKYKVGTVTMRHNHYTHAECYIDGEMVSEYKFKKELAKETEPPIPTEPVPAQPTAEQLTIAF